MQGFGWLCQWPVVSVDRKTVVTDWLASIAGAFCTGLELTMLPDAGSRGRFCADMSVGAVSAGPEAEEAGRASAGSTSMLNPKIVFFPVVQEMFATVHAAGSSLLGLFTSCATFDSTTTLSVQTSFFYI